ncbi:MAG TPA: PilZ domain-containing protein [Candidatus Acidoferrum sp.]|nr:PilZ domain-containing protein [Candidatus Acidoferrum sp.]
MNDMIERRKSPRRPKTEPVKITVREGHTLTGTVQNLGQGGLLASLAEEVELGLVYRLEFTDSDGVLSLMGEALRIHMPPSDASSGEPRMFMIAFEFVGMGDSAANRLAQLVKDLDT